jgi:hypothetical protein
MARVLNGIINSAAILDIQKVQYSEKLVMSGTVPAASEQSFSIAISNLGNFICQKITGSYTSLVLDAAAIVDDGVCHMRGQLNDGAQQTMLFNDFIPFDLFASPGRRKSNLSTTVLTDAVAGQYLNPFEFEYCFRMNGSILMKVKNDSDTANSFSLCFSGIRTLNSANMQG